MDRSAFYQIEKKLERIFHIISDNDLINLKYAFQQSPKMGSPNFNIILTDILTEALPQLNKEQLIHLFYANRHDNFRLYRRNLQRYILEHL